MRIQMIMLGNQYLVLNNGVKIQIDINYARWLMTQRGIKVEYTTKGE